MLKVVLYNPPMKWSSKSHKQTPLGLCYLSRAIKGEADCEVFNGNVLAGFHEYVKKLKAIVPNTCFSR